MSYLKNFLKKVVGSSSVTIKKIKPLVTAVLDLESTFSTKSNEELQKKTYEFKELLSNGKSIDDLLIESFAICREASFRIFGYRHFEEQIIGGVILNQGKIAEMKTGEGKTLVATLPAYLNALVGNGVHIVTVNDYLATRDSEWMGKIYRFLGLSVSSVIHGLNDVERKKVYASDILYATNNELAFDYLRDNMVTNKLDKVQRTLSYAIIDEVDSILIDEARTPLIISSPGGKSNKLYELAETFVKNLKFNRVKEVDSKEEFDEKYVDLDYVIDEKNKTSTLTKTGIEKAEKFFGIENLTDVSAISVSHHISQALKAHGNMKADVDYVIKDGKVIIVDEFTGRLMPGRRYSDGLHQAIEAKEKVKIESESKTLATITFQNYFRMYKKLSGMTGTAKTEETEFQQIYGLSVIEIPTHKLITRKDETDVVYKSENAKFEAVLKEVKEAHLTGQPILVGTNSIESSEKLSTLFKKDGIKHSVLSAKFHEKEAEIVSQAGAKGSVTIATNMAGRGTDITLGGNSEFLAKKEMKRLGYSDLMIQKAMEYGETNDERVKEAKNRFQEILAKTNEALKPCREEVKKLGGLYIIGTERHDNRRIDNQLRGRSGRQGDPGRSRFFLSLEDSLMRLFCSEKVIRVMDKLGIDDSEPIRNKMVASSIEHAQKRLESANFNSRKHVLEYDDINNKQREIIYKQRDFVLNEEKITDEIFNMFEKIISRIVDKFAPINNKNKFNFSDIRAYFEQIFLKIDDNCLEFDENEIKDKKFNQKLKTILFDIAKEQYKTKSESFGDRIQEVEKIILLHIVDEKWMEHIENTEQLKRGIHLRGYGQRDPLVEYKIETMEMFEEMIDMIQEDVVRYLLRASINQSNMG